MGRKHEQGLHRGQNHIELREENAKLRDALKALMVGTVVELCDTRDAAACKECSMRRNNVDCALTEAMELLGVDSHGEPMEAWKNE